jgi:predicted O-methyltransferase YrrM
MPHREGVMGGDETMNDEPQTAIDRRRIGEYGHYVASIEQLMDDLDAFLGGIRFQGWRSELRIITRTSMGVHPEEAMILYALTRALTPALVLETGTFRGYSTTEIARALRANGTGHMLTVDIDLHAGDLVPETLQDLVSFHRGTNSHALACALERDATEIDMFFHDSLHTYMNALGELIWFAPCFKPGTVIVCHDAKMDFMPEFGVGRAVREIAEALSLPFRILDTTCGLAILRWPEGVSPTAVAELRRKHAADERIGRIPEIARRVRRRLGAIAGRQK